MSHWTHFITEDDITNTVNTVAPEQWEVEEQWEAERLAVCNADNEAEKAKHEVFHFSFNNPEALRAEIIEMLAEEAEDIAIAEANAKAEWKAFLDSLPAWQRQWSERVLRRLKGRKDQALESEARRAELSGLMVCGDDEWGRR